MNEISSRIRQCVEQSGLNKSGFAKRINVTPSHVSQMCSGAKVPSDRTIADICREFNINEAWLRTGEGEMLNTAPTDDVDLILDKYGLPRELRGLFIGYLNMSDGAKKEVRDLILRWATDVVSQSTAVLTMAVVEPMEQEQPEESTGEVPYRTEEEIQEKMAAYEALLRGEQRMRRQFETERLLLGNDSETWIDPNVTGGKASGGSAG